MRSVFLSIISITFIFLFACKKKTETDPNLAFKSLKTLVVHSGAAPKVPFIMVKGYSLESKNNFIGIHNCDDPENPGPFITDSSMVAPLQNIFRDQDDKSIMIPGNPTWLENTATTAYWIDISEKGKIKKRASFERNAEYRKLFLCGLKDGYLWALDGNTVEVKCYNLNLAVGKHITDMNTLVVSTLKFPDIIGDGYAVEKGNILYLAGSSGNVYCIDITARSAPQVLSVIKEQQCTGLELENDVLICNSNTKIIVIDVKDAANPEIKSRINLKFGDAILHNGFLYAGFQEMRIYDLANLAKPKLVKNLNIAPYELTDIYCAGDYIFCRAQTAPYFTPATYPYIFGGNKL